MVSRRGCLSGVAVALAGCINSREGNQPPAVTGSWTHLNGGNAGGTRATATEPFESAPAESWSIELAERFAPLLIDGEILYSQADESFARRSLADGSVRWDRSFSEFVRIGPTVGDRLYATTGHDQPIVHAFAVPDGAEPTEEWTVEGIRAARADEDMLVGVSNDRSRLFTFDPDGTERWSITAQEIAQEAVDGFGPIVLGEEHVFAVAEQFPSTGWVAGLGRESGTIRWSALDPNQNTVLAATPDVVVSAGNETGATGFSPTDNQLWQVETDGRVETAAIVDDRVFLNDETGTVTALTTRGDEMWTKANAQVVAVDREVAYSIADGVSALGVEDGEERWTLDAAASFVVPVNEGLFTLTDTGTDENRLRFYQ